MPSPVPDKLTAKRVRVPKWIMLEDKRGAALKQRLADSLKEEIDKLFDTERDPDGKRWFRNKPSTIRKKGHSKVLTGGGPTAGKLRAGITSTVQRDGEGKFRIVLTSTARKKGSGVDYGNILQAGFDYRYKYSKEKGTKGRKGHRPGRPFLGISKEMKKRALAIVKNYYQSGAK